ncbi:MAG: glycoside hydrolase family 172 protein [Verrucomicrobiota bacterium]
MNLKKSRNEGWRGFAEIRLLLLCGACLFPAPVFADRPVTLDSLLDEMVDFESVARWPDPEYKCLQASSHDRATVAPDQPGWFANDDHTRYLRTEETDGRRENVMMDAAGPGCLIRFWLTTIKNKKGTLRIYLDGEEKPALTFPAYDLLAGDLRLEAPLAQPHPGYSPVENGGNTLMLPVPYAKHCKVTWEESGEGPRYYQINYRTYQAGTVVSTFTPARLEAARPRIGTVAEGLLSPPAASEGKRLSLERALSPGKTAYIDLPAGPAAVRQMEFRLTTDDPSKMAAALRSTIVQFRFDGEDSVWCPAGDFFGSGVGVNPLTSWYRTVRPDGTMVCRWVMPYAKAARLTFANTGGQSVGISTDLTISSWKWDDRSMHFHTTWHSELELATPPGRDWNFVNITGRGVYVGDTLSLFNPVATWYGEGDEKIRVDGESTPSHLGTGTEDYYGYSFAPRGVMQTPFANQIRVDQAMTQGYNILTRSRNLDGIPFRKSLSFDIELMSWKPTRPTYAATTHWYAAPGAASNRRPEPEEANRHLPTLADAQAAGRIPGAIECEDLKVVASSPDLAVMPQDMEAFGGGRWSGGSQLLARAGAVGEFLEIEIKAADSSPRRLKLRATRAPDFGILRFKVNDLSVPRKFDGYAPDVRPAEEIDLGVFTPKDGRFRLRIEVDGSNSAATGSRFYLGMDCIIPETP